MNFWQKSWIFQNLLKFMPIYAHFPTFFDAFFLPISPKLCKLTRQPSFLTQKQGLLPKSTKKTWKYPISFKIYSLPKNSNLPILPHYYPLHWNQKSSFCETKKWLWAVFYPLLEMLKRVDYWRLITDNWYSNPHTAKRYTINSLKQKGFCIEVCKNYICHSHTPIAGTLRYWQVSKTGTSCNDNLCGIDYCRMWRLKAGWRTERNGPAPRPF